jgi:hypothetical protein
MTFEEWFTKQTTASNYHAHHAIARAAYAAGAASRDEECLKRYSQGYDDGAAAMRERCAEEMRMYVVNTDYPNWPITKTALAMVLTDIIRKTGV